MSAGSRFCALARPNALGLSLCTRRHRSQWQPLFHPACVPLLTPVRVAKSPLAAPCRRSALESDMGPTFQLPIVERDTFAGDVRGPQPPS